MLPHIFFSLLWIFTYARVPIQDWPQEGQIQLLYPPHQPHFLSGYPYFLSSPLNKTHGHLQQSESTWRPSLSWVLFTFYPPTPNFIVVFSKDVRPSVWHYEKKSLKSKTYTSSGGTQRRARKRKMELVQSGFWKRHRHRGVCQRRRNLDVYPKESLVLILNPWKP